MRTSEEKRTARESEHRRRTREAILIALILVITVASLLIFRKIVNAERGIARAGDWLVLALFNLHLVLVILMLFLIFRSIFKLFLERRRRILGARLKTKLVTTFLAVAILPAGALFFIAYVLITYSIDEWFSTKVENALEASLEVAQTFYKSKMQEALFFSRQLSRNVTEQNLLQEQDLGVLDKFLRQKQLEYKLGTIEVFTTNGDEVAFVQHPEGPALGFTNPNSEYMKRALGGDESTAVLSLRNEAGVPEKHRRGDLIKGVVPIYSAFNPAEVAGAIAVSYYIPESLEATMQQIRQNYEDHKALVILKKPVRQSYVLVLAAISLLVLFAAVWLGIHFSKVLTEPIQDLAEATREVASGNLDFQIESRADDEFGTVVTSFNRMTADLKRSNAELDRRRRHMETILKNVAAGVVSVNRWGRVTTINKSAEKLFAVPAKELLGRRYSKLLSTPDHRENARKLVRDLQRARAETVERQIQITVRENTYTLLVSLSLLRDEGGETIGLVVVFDDLTQLLKAQRMAAWREVARRIAHEIKNPLTPIQLSAQRIRTRYSDRLGVEGDVLDECTEIIITAVDELKTLVNEFSNFARMPASNPEPNELNAIVSETAKLYQVSHKHIALLLSLDANLPVFNLDREQMKRVIINILDNAIHALDGEGGEIRLATSYHPNLAIARLEISDNGQGLSREARSRLFEPYFSTKKSGSGLGLSIVSSIIADHNGYIRVRDNQPRGTTFIIELPIRT